MHARGREATVGSRRQANYNPPMTEASIAVAAGERSILFPRELAPEAERFLATLPYDPRAFFVDEVVAIDRSEKRVRAKLDTRRPLPLSDLQRGDPRIHPRHVNGAVLVHVTGVLGSLHAYFVNGLRFDEGWIGFGSRIHRADFKRLVRIGPPLDLVSVETRLRASPDRQIARYEFHFSQDGELCYAGDQTATWLRGRAFEEDASAE
jgi:hypothetical protein